MAVLSSPEPPLGAERRRENLIPGTERRAAIVTGGAGEGIGQGITEALLEDGWAVLVVDRDREATERLRERLHARADQLEILTVDITDVGVAEMAVDSAVSCFGRLGGLVNSAGVGLCKPVGETTDEEFSRLIDVDLRAAFRFSRAAIQRMMPSGGSIVNISSVHASRSIAGYGAYASVKAGLDGLTRAIAIDYGAQRIRANAIHPGYVASPQNRELISRLSSDPDAWIMNYATTRQLLPEVPSSRQVGELAAFLLGPRSSAITGQAIAIDGGTSAMLMSKEERP